ncbi:MAG: hypothetical protein ABJC33_03555 [Betaproteobacteria bacterium]
MDVSAWWVLGAFLAGGYAGALLVALMTVAASDGGNPAERVDGTGARWSV